MLVKEHGDRDVHLACASQSIAVSRREEDYVWLAGQLTFGLFPLQGHGIATAFKIELEPSFVASRIWSQPTFLYQWVHTHPQLFVGSGLSFWSFLSRLFIVFLNQTKLSAPSQIPFCPGQSLYLSAASVPLAFLCCLTCEVLPRVHKTSRSATAAVVPVTTMLTAYMRHTWPSNNVFFWCLMLNMSCQPYREALENKVCLVSSIWSKMWHIHPGLPEMNCLIAIVQDCLNQ